MSDKVLYQEELDHMKCGTPGCNERHGPMFFHGRCHMRAKTECSYDPATGLLLIACAQCNREIATVAVARRGTVQ